MPRFLVTIKDVTVELKRVTMSASRRSDDSQLYQETRGDAIARRTQHAQALMGVGVRQLVGGVEKRLRERSKGTEMERREFNIGYLMRYGMDCCLQDVKSMREEVLKLGRSGNKC